MSETGNSAVDTAETPASGSEAHPTATSAVSPLLGWFGGATRPLFIHAHPDDESITTGGTLAGLGAQGIQAGVITCTRGEQGEVREGSAQQLVRESSLAHVRENELRRALAALGVTWHCFLGTAPARDTQLAAASAAPASAAPASVASAAVPGAESVCYQDSGMQWGPDGRALPSPAAPPEAFTRVSPALVLRDLLVGVVAYSADALVSYDLGGGYGHPDHQLAHRLTSAVAEALELPFWEIVPVRTGSVETASAVGEGVERYDVSPWLAQKSAALAAYDTQLQVADGVITHVGGQTEPVSPCESYRRVF